MCKHEQKLIKPAACYSLTWSGKFDINKWIRKHNEKNKNR